MSGTIEALVSRRATEADGIITLELTPLPGQTLPPFEPGSHIDLHVGGGLVRQYSLCGDPAVRACYRIGVLLDPTSRGGSAAVHAELHPGRHVRISTPRNSFPIVRSARSIFLAGGIGLTPILAMMYALRREGAEFHLHYFARTRSRAAFLAELAEFPDRFSLHFDDAPGGLAFDPARDIALDAETHLYICGPNGFMDVMVANAQSLGWEKSAIHLERFGAKLQTAGESFTVVAARSNRTVEVHEGCTIAEALRAAGIVVPVSCEQGVCGTCLTRVLEGVPDHRDLFQMDQEKAANNQIAVCCSRSLSAVLRLDL